MFMMIVILKDIVYICIFYIRILEVLTKFLFCLFRFLLVLVIFYEMLAFTKILKDLMTFLRCSNKGKGYSSKTSRSLSPNFGPLMLF